MAGGREIDDALEGASFEATLDEDTVKEPSTALSQLADVGVKWNVQRGWRLSHSIILGACGGSSCRG
jgi:hypothetical protein